MARKGHPYKKKIFRNYSIKLLAGLSSIAGSLHADTPLGLVGGQDSSSNAYGAFLSQKDELLPITGLPVDGNSVINAVALNRLGTGLIAGRSGVDGYAAFVNTNGVITPFSFSFPNGYLSSANINSSGLGLVGGLRVSSEGYAAYLLQDGTINQLSISADTVESTALNDSGVGLIGGEGSAAPYAVYSTPDGTLTPISAGSNGHIYTVSINALGKGIIGGWSDTGTYAAFTMPDGTPTPLGSLPSGYGFIKSSAINSSGAALIGGFDSSNNAYLASVSSDGTVTALFGSLFPGSIDHAALNDGGTGLVAGTDSSNVYAALVQSNGSLIPLFAPSTSGTINGVAINREGLGLIGGDISGSYLALVAPNGTLTPISLSNVGNISSTSILTAESHSDSGSNSNPILRRAVPSSTGPYNSAIYTQLSAHSALDVRFIEKNKVWKKKPQNTSTENTAQYQSIADKEKLLAYNNEKLLPSFSQDQLALSPKQRSTPGKPEVSSKKNSIWLEPFGSFVHLKEEDSTPSYSNEVGGVLLGYDREGSSYIVGGALGYAFNYIHYSDNLGHGKIQEELANLYGAYYTDHFWVASALWGGFYQLSNKRVTLSQIASKGHAHGWILTPHLEMASPWKISNDNYYYIEPFFSLDWINNWQSSYTEIGSSGLNLKVPSVYDSLLQSEVGLRFYERFSYSWGALFLEEKLSYVNQAPFGFNSATTSFVSSASTFPIAVGSSKVQNLGAFQILGSFVPSKSSYYGGFSFQVTAGSAYQSYFGSLFVGVDF